MKTPHILALALLVAGCSSESDGSAGTAADSGIDAADDSHAGDESEAAADAADSCKLLEPSHSSVGGDGCTSVAHYQCAGHEYEIVCSCPDAACRCTKDGAEVGTAAYGCASCSVPNDCSCGIGPFSSAALECNVPDPGSITPGGN